MKKLFLLFFPLFVFAQLGSDTTEKAIDQIKPNSTDAVSILAPIELEQTSTPANPASGFNRIYAKSDDFLYWLTAGGVERKVLVNPADLTSEVTGVLPFANGGIPTIGTDGQLLTLDGGVAAWLDAPVSTTLATKGDLQGFDGTDNIAVPAGTDGQVLTADSAAASGLSYQDPPSGSLQGVYDSSADGEIVVDSTLGSFEVRDNATVIGAPLFEVKSNDESASYLSVDATGAEIGGTLDVTGNSTLGGITTTTHLDAYGQFRVQSATIPSHPFPDMDTATMDAAALIFEGDSVFNTDTDAIHTYNGAEWDRIAKIKDLETQSNYIINPRFEYEMDDWTITGCTPEIVDDLGKTLKLTCAGEAFSVKQTFSTGLGEGQLIGSAKVKASAQGVKFRVLEDANVIKTLDVRGNSNYKNPSIPFRVSTDNTVEIYADNFTGEVFIDDVKAKVAEGYVQSIESNYENYEEIDATGSGDFTGGIIAVGRVGNIVTVALEEDTTHASLSVAASAAGVLPKWARPAAAKYNTYAGTSNIFNMRVEANGSVVFEYYSPSGALVTRTSPSVVASITYLAADAEAPTNHHLVSQASNSPDKAGFLLASFVEFENGLEGYLPADGDCILKTAYPDYTRNTKKSDGSYQYGECTVSATNDGVLLPDMITNGLFVRARNASNPLGVEQADMFKSHNHDPMRIGSGNGTATIFNNALASAGSSVAWRNYGHLSSTGGSETRPKNLPIMPYVRMVDRNYIVGSFEQIKSTELIYDKLSKGTMQSIPTHSWVTVSGITYYVEKSGKYELNVSATWIDFETNSSSNIRVIVDGDTKGSGLAWEHKSSTGFSSVEDEITTDLIEGQAVTIQVWQDSGSPQNFNLFQMRIKQLPTTETIIKNMNDNNNVECQTKFLSAAVTTTGSISDLSFSGMEIGKKYKIISSVAMLVNSGDTQVVLNFSGGGNILSLTLGNGSGAGIVSSSGGQRIFVAKSETLNAESQGVNAGTSILSDNSSTFAQLCQLPDNYIETEKF